MSQCHRACPRRFRWHASVLGTTACDLCRKHGGNDCLSSCQSMASSKLVALPHLFFSFLCLVSARLFSENHLHILSPTPHCLSSPLSQPKFFVDVAGHDRTFFFCRCHCWLFPLFYLFSRSSPALLLPQALAMPFLRNGNFFIARQLHVRVYVFVGMPFRSLPSFFFHRYHLLS